MDAFRKDKADEDRIARAVVAVSRRLGISAARLLWRGWSVGGTGHPHYWR